MNFCAGIVTKLSPVKTKPRYCAVTKQTLREKLTTETRTAIDANTINTYLHELNKDDIDMSNTRCYTSLQDAEKALQSMKQQHPSAEQMTYVSDIDQSTSFKSLISKVDQLNNKVDQLQERALQSEQRVLLAESIRLLKNKIIDDI